MTVKNDSRLNRLAQASNQPQVVLCYSFNILTMLKLWKLGFGDLDHRIRCSELIVKSRINYLPHVSRKSNSIIQKIKMEHLLSITLLQVVRIIY